MLITEENCHECLLLDDPFQLLGIDLLDVVGQVQGLRTAQEIGYHISVTQVAYIKPSIKYMLYCYLLALVGD